MPWSKVIWFYKNVFLKCKPEVKRKDKFALYPTVTLNWYFSEPAVVGIWYSCLPYNLLRLWKIDWIFNSDGISSTHFPIEPVRHKYLQFTKNIYTAVGTPLSHFVSAQFLTKNTSTYGVFRLEKRLVYLIRSTWYNLVRTCYPFFCHIVRLLSLS